MERFSFVFLVAGLGFFGLAFVVSAWLPWMQFDEEEYLKTYKTVEQLAEKPPLEFYELQEQYPEAFEKAYGDHKTADGAYDMSKAFADALVVGRKVGGARSWFGVGGFGIQPSEFAKMGAALALAWFCSKEGGLNAFGQRIRAALIVGIPAGLILLQPDAGTVLVFLGFVFAKVGAHLFA